MPIITCPKCQGKLRFPDDTPARRVKCPTCGNVFMSTEGADPSTASPTAPPKPADSRSEFTSDGDRSRRRRDEDDDRDRDRRSRRRNDDDDDRDRDRRSRRRNDDDDRRPRRRDEDDDRDRRRDREDDDDDRRRRPRRDDDYDRRRREPDPAALEDQFNRAGLSCPCCSSSAGGCRSVPLASWCLPSSSTGWRRSRGLSGCCRDCSALAVG